MYIRRSLVFLKQVFVAPRAIQVLDAIIGLTGAPEQNLQNQFLTEMAAILVAQVKQIDSLVALNEILHRDSQNHKFLDQKAIGTLVEQGLYLVETSEDNVSYMASLPKFVMYVSMRVPDSFDLLVQKVTPNLLKRADSLAIDRFLWTIKLITHSVKRAEPQTEEAIRAMMSRVIMLCRFMSLTNLRTNLEAYADVNTARLSKSLSWSVETEKTLLNGIQAISQSLMSRPRIGPVKEEDIVAINKSLLRIAVDDSNEAALNTVKQLLNSLNNN